MGIGGFWYGALVVDDATRMKFPMTLKSKDEIGPQNVAIFHKVKTHTGRKIKFFRTDDGREFQGLAGTLNKKVIEW